MSSSPIGDNLGRFFKANQRALKRKAPRNETEKTAKELRSQLIGQPEGRVKNVNPVVVNTPEGKATLRTGSNSYKFLTGSSGSTETHNDPLVTAKRNDLGGGILQSHEGKPKASDSYNDYIFTLQGDSSISDKDIATDLLEMAVKGTSLGDKYTANQKSAAAKLLATQSAEESRIPSAGTKRFRAALQSVISSEMTLNEAFVTTEESHKDPEQRPALTYAYRSDGKNPTAGDLSRGLIMGTRQQTGKESIVEKNQSQSTPEDDSSKSE